MTYYTNLLLFSMLVLTSCTTPAERAQQDAIRAQQQEQYENNECLKLNFTPNTDAFRNCRLQIRLIQAKQEMREQLNALEAENAS